MKNIIEQAREIFIGQAVDLPVDSAVVSTMYYICVETNMNGTYCQINVHCLMAIIPRAVD